MTRGIFSFLKKVFSYLGQKKFFIYCYLVPFICFFVYFCFIQSDVYVSESAFIVRQPEQKSVSSLSVLLSSVGVSSVREEAYVVKSFSLSRDSIKTLNENLNLKNIFGNKEIDIFSRFNPIGMDDSFEALYKYISGYITVEVDASSSISNLKVKAYSPNIARNINEGLLFLSEGLINKLNTRARNDMVDTALQEVNHAEEEARKCALALSTYQDKETLFDPAQQSTMQLQHVARLQSELIDVRGQLAQYREFAAASPSIRGLEKRAVELQKEINTEMSKVAGGSDSMTQKLIAYERLKLDREFSDKRLASALATLEQARLEAQRQRLYLERIAQPNLPDEAIYPRRLLNTLSAAGILLIAYGVIKLLVIGIIEHQQ